MKFSSLNSRGSLSSTAGGIICLSVKRLFQAKRSEYLRYSPLKAVPLPNLDTRIDPLNLGDLSVIFRGVSVVSQEAPLNCVK